MPSANKQQSERGRPRKFDETEALSIALKVFQEQGYDAAGTDALSHSMGMKKQSVYRTFGNKSALFDRCFESYLTEIVKSLETSFENANSLRTAFRSCLIDAAEYFHQSQIAGMGCMITVTAPVTPEKAPLARQAIETLEAVLTSQLIKKFQAEVSAAKMLATLLVAYIQSLAIRARTGTPLNELLATCETFLASLASLPTKEIS
ncbi:Copper outer membrane regulator [Roseibium album]|nr:Copper outer membrane regulator [Roseibium album]